MAACKSCTLIKNRTIFVPSWYLLLILPLQYRLLTGVCVPRPTAPGPYLRLSVPQPSGPCLLYPWLQNIARLNTILLFNFEVVITLKL